MASNPFFEGDIGGQASTLIDALAETPITRPPPELAIDIGRPGRQMCVYPARAGYDLQTELDFLANRMIEPNVFFTGRFLAPAMPRLDDRQVPAAHGHAVFDRASWLFSRPLDHSRLVASIRSPRHATGRCRRCSRNAR
jgi:hypothetical protein